MVILGWILDKPLPLLFDPFESIVRFRLAYHPLVLFIWWTCIGFVYLW
jgi:hypothetical protein